MQHPTPNDDARRRFRELLEAKKAGARPGTKPGTTARPADGRGIRPRPAAGGRTHRRKV